MKKIVFALQVIGLIALLPVCVAMEMNHGTTKAEVIIEPNSANSFVDFRGSITKYPISIISLTGDESKTEKKNGNTGCSCQDCKCGASCMCSDL